MQLFQQSEFRLLIQLTDLRLRKKGFLYLFGFLLQPFQSLLLHLEFVVDLLLPVVALLVKGIQLFLRGIGSGDFGIQVRAEGGGFVLAVLFGQLHLLHQVLDVDFPHLFLVLLGGELIIKVVLFEVVFLLALCVLQIFEGLIVGRFFACAATTAATAATTGCIYSYVSSTDHSL